MVCATTIDNTASCHFDSCKLSDRPDTITTRPHSLTRYCCAGDHRQRRRCAVGVLCLLSFFFAFCVQKQQQQRRQRRRRRARTRTTNGIILPLCPLCRCMCMRVSVCEKEGEPNIFMLPFYPFSLLPSWSLPSVACFCFCLLFACRFTRRCSLAENKKKKTFRRLILRFVLPALFCLVVAL